MSGYITFHVTRVGVDLQKWDAYLTDESDEGHDTEYFESDDFLGDVISDLRQTRRERDLARSLLSLLCDPRPPSPDDEYLEERIDKRWGIGRGGKAVATQFDEDWDPSRDFTGTGSSEAWYSGDLEETDVTTNL